MLKRLSICSVFVLGFALLLTAAPAKAQMGIPDPLKVSSKILPAGDCRRDGRNLVRGERLPQGDDHGKRRELQVHERPLQFLSFGGDGRGFENYTHDVDVRSAFPRRCKLA